MLATEPVPSSRRGARDEEMVDCATRILHNGLGKYFGVCHVRYQELLDALEVDGILLETKVDLVFADPPQIIHCVAGAWL